MQIYILCISIMYTVCKSLLINKYTINILHDTVFKIYIFYKKYTYGLHTEYVLFVSFYMVSVYKCISHREMSHANHFYIKLILCNIDRFCNYSSNFNYYAHAN
jgi:hypothetical protein